jgi:riboflavin synthase
VFTGIVKHSGSIVRVLRRGGGARLEVNAPGVAAQLSVGDSVAVNGACVTVVERNDQLFAADLVPETLARTNLGTLQPDEEVNLELSLRAADRLDGHIVQGHVDAVGLVRSRRRVGAQEMLEVNVPFELTRYLAPKGSVSVDGVSLSVVDVNKDRFRVVLIPHTVATTTLGKKGQGAAVNIEVDVLSKYVERHTAVRSQPGPLWAIAAAGPKPQPQPTPVKPAVGPRPRPESRPRPAPGQSRALRRGTTAAKRSTRPRQRRR